MPAQQAQQAQQADHAALARSLSRRERRARALAQAEADAAEREAAEAEAELGAVAAEVARLVTGPEPAPPRGAQPDPEPAPGAWTRQLEGTIAHAIREPSSWLAVWPSAMRCRTQASPSRRGSVVPALAPRHSTDVAVLPSHAAMSSMLLRGPST